MNSMPTLKPGINIRRLRGIGKIRRLHRTCRAVSLAEAEYADFYETDRKMTSKEKSCLLR